MRLTEAHVAHIIGLERDGKLTPEVVLDDARQATSPIHELYDWDRDTAARAHWLERTREILRLIPVRVTTETETYTIPRYVHDPELAPGEQGYITLERLRGSDRLAHRALVTEFDRVVSSLRRARDIAVGLALDDEIDELLARVTGLQAIVKNGHDEPPSAPPPPSSPSSIQARA